MKSQIIKQNILTNHSDLRTLHEEILKYGSHIYDFNFDIESPLSIT